MLFLAVLGGASVTLIMMVLGFLGTGIMQAIKLASERFAVEIRDRVALWLTLIVSFLLAAGTVYVAGEWDAQNVIGSAGIVFSVATLVYKTLISPGASSEPVLPQADV